MPWLVIFQTGGLGGVMKTNYLWNKAREVYIKQGGTRESWSYEDVDTKIDCAQEVYEELLRQQANLIRTVKYYADKENYVINNSGCMPILHEQGRLAQATLKGLEIKQ